MNKGRRTIYMKKRKEKKEEGKQVQITEYKNRGNKNDKLEDTPPIVYPSFENSGSIITDNEYEITSEINNNYKEKKHS